MSSTAERPIASLKNLVADSEQRPPQATVKRAEEQDLVVPDLVVEDLLVEDVSIDGMCGVY